MKKYTVSLEDGIAEFYEDVARLSKTTPESVMADTLSEVLSDTLKKMLWDNEWEQRNDLPGEHSRQYN